MRFISFILVGLSLVGGLGVGFGFAADLEKGRDAYESEDYKTALQEFKPLAENGDSFAQFYLGVMLYRGEGLPQNKTKAAKWLSLAAEQGDPDAQFLIGRMYDEGEGVPLDDNKAFQYFSLAAEQKHALAQFFLGKMYDEGEGTPLNDKMAVKLYSMSAKQGYEVAQYNLGIMYYNGEGTPQDDVYAYVWFSLAAANGFEGAQEPRNDVAQTLTPEQLEEAQKLTRSYYESQYQNCP
jgi:TPR repeat protein